MYLKNEKFRRYFQAPATQAMMQSRRSVLNCERVGGAHLSPSNAYTPAQIIQNALCVVRWHKQTSFTVLFNLHSVYCVLNRCLKIRQLFRLSSFMALI